MMRSGETRTRPPAANERETVAKSGHDSPVTHRTLSISCIVTLPPNMAWKRHMLSCQ
jgi:hypothetical protein